jgi:hypothetical protein
MDKEKTFWERLRHTWNHLYEDEVQPKTSALTEKPAEPVSNPEPLLPKTPDVPTTPSPPADVASTQKQLAAEKREVPTDALDMLNPRERARYNILTRELTTLKPENVTDRQVQKWETDIDVLRKRYNVPDSVYKDYIDSINRAHETYKQEVDATRKQQAFNHMLAALGNVFIARFAAAAKGPGVQAIDLSNEMAQASRNLDAALKTADKKLDVAREQAQSERTLLNILQENERWNDAQERYNKAQTTAQRQEAKQDAQRELEFLINQAYRKQAAAERQQDRLDRADAAREVKELNQRSRLDEQAQRRREAEARMLQTRSDRLVSDIDKILNDKKIKNEDERLAAINTAITKSALPIPAEARKNLTTRVGFWESIAGPSKERLRNELEQTVSGSVQPYIDRIRSGAIRSVRFKKEGQPAMDISYTDYQKMSESDKQQILGDGWTLEYK